MQIPTCLTAFLLFISGITLAQPSIKYDVSFPNAVHHEAQITATFSGLSTDPLRVRMSRSSPGRYATHEFAKNMYRVTATDAKGNPFAITRVDPDSWEVATHGETVKVTYTLFGNLVDGTYTEIDPTHAHMNMPASFIWAKGMENSPISIQFKLPTNANWKVATQLKPMPDGTFYAPNLHYFMDSPTELSNYSLSEWSEVNTNGKPLTFRLAVHHDSQDKDIESYAHMVKKIVLEQKAVFGEWPEYDYGTYTFIQDVIPGNKGDGMEHRNSTIISDNASFNGDKTALLGTISHEFFHCWNVERIRPQSLEPFNFERANMSGELWFAEGFTQYYGDLTLCRAGFDGLAEYASTLAEGLNYINNLPGTMAFSPVEMSQQAPFVDAATAIDPTNFVNVYTSYYSYGCAVALALDLTLRSQFKNLSLDEYMRAVWRAHGKPEKPYTLADLQQVLAQVTKDEKFAKAFFEKYILGHELNNYPVLLAKAGLLMRKVNAGTAFLGREVGLRNGKITLLINALVGSPVYEAGLDRNDVIISLENEPVNTTDTYRAIMGRHKPGDKIAISYMHRGTEKSGSITFAEEPTIEIVPYETANQPINKSIKAFREGWLGTKVEKAGIK